MKPRNNVNKYLAVGLGVSALALGSTMTNAATVALCAGETTVTMTDGATVSMWGFALGGLNISGTACAGSIQIPGPTIDNGTDTTLTIALNNTLSVPVSIIIPGQSLPTQAGGTPSAPVYNNATATGRAKRVRSLVHETAPDSQAVYQWAALKPGSHIYHSATHQQVQVQMGLYGAMTGDVTTGEAYSGITYDSEVSLFYSEIDPVLHKAVATGCYGSVSIADTTCDGASKPNWMSSTLNYNPRYYLVNGMPSDGSVPIPAGNVSQNILIRLFNAGLKTHVPQTLGLYMKLYAENGYTLPYPKSQTSVTLHAMMTADVIINTASDGIYPIFDRRLSLSDGSTHSGMMSRLQISTGAATPVATDDTATMDEDTLATDPAAIINVISNDSATAPASIDPASVSVRTAPLNGTVVSNSDGTVTYTPNQDYNGTDQFSYTVNDTTGLTSGAATVSVSVAAINDAPIANADSYDAQVGLTLNIATANGVLANDTDVDNDSLSAGGLDITATAGAVTLSADGSFSYTPSATAVAGNVDTFSYTANDAGLSSTPATVTINILAPPPTAPTANPDSFTTNEDTATTINVLTNDTAGSVTIDVASLSIVSGPAHGSVVVDATGNVTYTPTLNYNGSDQFSYTVNDSDAPARTSNQAIVSVTVNSVNDAPVGVADTYSIPYWAGVTVTPVDSAVLVNDTDIENDPLSSPPASLNTNGTAGAVILYSDGSFAYTPASNAAAGNVDTFTYAANDGAANSNATTVTINIIEGTPVANELPIANNDRVTYSRTSNSNGPMSFNMSVLLANDTDQDDANFPAGSTIQLTDANNDLIADTRRNGSSIVFDSATEILTYTPVPGGSTRNDRFWYTVIDARGGVSNRATVIVRVIRATF